MLDSPRILQQVADVTRSCWSDEFVALYAYGSLTRGDLDDWSDIDLCLIARPGDAGYERRREWANSPAWETVGRRVDPLALSTDDLGPSASWGYAGFAHCLLANSRLLLGEDFRPLIAQPTEHKLRLCAGWAALHWVRAVYSIPLGQRLPHSLPELALDEEPGSLGNVAWRVATTILHQLRAIVLLETGVFCESKQAIRDELVRRGEERLATHCEDILALRKETPRFGPLPEVPTRLVRLAAAIPELTCRVLDSLARHGLEDPSYEPDGSVYAADGSLRQLAQAG
jgi:hypothetical protein